MREASPREWLRPFVAGMMPIFREVLAMSFFVNILALAVPVFTMQVYDRVVAHGGINTLVGLILGMVFVLLFDYILRQTRSRILQKVALQIDVKVGRQLFDKVMAVPLQALETKPGSYWQSMFRDVDVVRNTLSGSSAVLMMDLPFALLFFAVPWIVAPAVAWVLLIILPIFLFVAWRSGATMGNANRQERKTSQNRDGLIAEIIGGRTTIKALALDGALRPIWEELHAENIERSLIRGSRADAYTSLGSTLTMMTTVLMTTVGALAILDGRLTMGGLIASNMIVGRLIGPMNQLVNQWRTYANFVQAVERLGELFSSPSERIESEIKLEKPEGDIVIENASFAYTEDGQPVVNNVTLHIPKGGVTALVGRNGCGKTTLLKIIQGLYKPSNGRVLLDGADLSQFSRSELAQWIGYVPQSIVLFSGTVRDNIAQRMPDATDEQIIAASKASGVHQFIIDMPDGYATEIGEAGQRLSGGQRQRISIARALVGDPPVLLLDEPSSSLDRQAEQELRKTLMDIGERTTVIVVTHSPLLLAACRDMVALDRGKVALAGPAKDLLPRLFGAGARALTEQAEAERKAKDGGDAKADTAKPAVEIRREARPDTPKPAEDRPAIEVKAMKKADLPAAKPTVVPREPKPLPAAEAKPQPAVVEPPKAEPKTEPAPMPAAASKPEPALAARTEPAVAPPAAAPVADQPPAAERVATEPTPVTPAEPEAKPKAEEPKAEEPRAEEPRAEEPRAEEPRAEEPRAEEPRAEEPAPEPKEAPIRSAVATRIVPPSRRPRPTPLHVVESDEPERPIETAKPEPTPKARPAERPAASEPARPAPPRPAARKAVPAEPRPEQHSAVITQFPGPVKGRRPGAPTHRAPKFPRAKPQYAETPALDSYFFGHDRMLDDGPEGTPPGGSGGPGNAPRARPGPAAARRPNAMPATGTNGTRSAHRPTDNAGDVS